MEFITLSMDEIKPYINNPRNNDKAVDAVAASIEQCGYISPIIIDENGVILAGHTRYRALNKLGIKQVPVVIKRGLTDDQKRKYRILDNRTAELSYWDYEKLYQELDGLDFDNFKFGFEKLLNALDHDIDSGFEYDVEDFGDEQFKHECPECGFRFN